MDRRTKVVQIYKKLCEYIETEKGKVLQRKIKIVVDKLELTENKNEN